MADIVYDSGRVVLEAVLFKLTATQAGQSWEPRHVVLTPTTVMVFKNADRPSTGAKPKSMTTLGDGAAVEVVHEGEVDEHKPYAFSVIPSNTSAETVLAAHNEAQYRAWVDGIHRQVTLAAEAQNRNMMLNTRGDLLDSAGAVAIPVSKVLGIVESTPVAAASGAPPLPPPPPPTAAAAPTAISGSTSALPPPPPPPPATVAAGSAGAAPEQAAAPPAGSAASLPAAAAANSPSGQAAVSPVDSAASVAASSGVPPPPPPPPAVPVAPSEGPEAGAATQSALPPPPPPGAGVPAAPSSVPVAAGSWASRASDDAGSVTGGSVAGGSTSASNPAATPQDLPRRPKNTEVDPALRLGSLPVGTAGSSMAPTGARVRGKVTSDMDAPPAPPERGASSRPAGTAATPTSIAGGSQGSLGFAAPAPVPLIGVASKNHFIPSAALQSKGIEMPKPKFKAWAEGGGAANVPPAAAAAQAEYDRRDVRGKADANAALYALASPARAYPHGMVAGQKGEYEGPLAMGQAGQAGVPSSVGAASGDFFASGVTGIGAGLHDDDNESTVGSIAGVPTSMTGLNPLESGNSNGAAPAAPTGSGPRVTFADAPVIMQAPAPAPAPEPVVPPTPAGLSLTTASPAYSYPQMGGGGGSSAAPALSANVMAAIYSRTGTSLASTLPAMPGSTPGGAAMASTPGPRGSLQPRRLAEVAPPLPKNATATAGLPASRFSGVTGSAVKAPQDSHADGLIPSASPGESPGRGRNPTLDATREAVQAAIAASVAAGHQVDSILRGHSPPSKAAAIAAALAAAGTQVAQPGPAMPPPPGSATPAAAQPSLPPAASPDATADDDDEARWAARSRSGSIDAGALAALDAVDIDNRSVATGHTGSIDTWAFYYGPDADKERADALRGRGGGDDDDDRQTEGTRRTHGGTPLPPLPPAPKLVPLRDVKRAFDAATVYSEGVLPLNKLPELSSSLGMPLASGWAGDASMLRELGVDASTPVASAQVSRNDFLAWWKRAAVAKIKAHEAETLRIAALAAVRARESGPGPAVPGGASARERRQRRRATGAVDAGKSWESSTVHTATDRDTVTTFGERETDADTHTGSTVSLDRLRASQAMYAAMGLVMGPDGVPVPAAAAAAALTANGADGAAVPASGPVPEGELSAAEAALAAVEASLQPIAQSAAQLLEELQATLAGGVGTVEAAAPSSSGSDRNSPTAAEPADGPSVEGSSAQAVQADKENKPEWQRSNKSAAPSAHPTAVASAVDSRRGSMAEVITASAAVGSAQLSGEAGAPENGGESSAMDGAITGEPAEQDGQLGGAVAKAAKAWLNKYRDRVPDGEESSSRPGSASSQSSANSFSSVGSPHRGPKEVPVPLELPTGLQGALARAALAAVAASLGGEVDENAGVPPSAYEAPYLLPMPPALPPTFVALGKGIPVAKDAKGNALPPPPKETPSGLGLAFEFTDPLLTAEAARFPNMTVDEQEARAVAAELGVAPTGDGKIGMPFALAAPRGVQQVDVAGTVTSVLSGEIGEEDWNERYQRLMEKPEWRFSAAVSKAVSVSAFLGRFSSVACEAAATIVEEMSLPSHAKSLLPMSMGVDNGDGPAPEPVWFHKGVLLKLAGPAPSPRDADLESDSTVLVAGPRAIEHKVAGHTLRGLALVADAGAAVYRDWAASAGTPDARRAAGKRRPPPLCAPLTCVVDYGGVRLYAMAIPPMDDANTLVVGRAVPAYAAPFVQRSPLLASMLRRVGRCLNLKPHAVEAPTFASVQQGAATPGDKPGAPQEDDSTLATRTLVLPLSVDVAGHSGTDKRLYLMNAARLLPADAPHAAAAAALGSASRAIGGAGGMVAPGAASFMGDNALLACQLRPEFVRGYEKALSADAYRAVPTGSSPETEGAVTIGHPPDAATNDLDVARASTHLISTVIPAFVAALEAGAVNVSGLGADRTPAGQAAGSSPLHSSVTAACLPGCPYDSASFTAALHTAGINARHLGRVAAACTLPYARELCEVEMIGRCVKTLLAKEMRAVVAQPHVDEASNAQAHVLLVRGGIAHKACELFNLCLGSSDAGSAWWRNVLAPLVTAKFGYELHLFSPSDTMDDNMSVLPAAGSTGARGHHPCPVHRMTLMRALEHHCGVRLHPSLPVLPPNMKVPRLTPIPGATTVDSIMTMHAQGAEILLSTGPAGPTPAGSLSSAEKELYNVVPAIAPLSAMTGPNPSKGPSTSFVSLPMAVKPVYDLSTAEPFTPSALKTLHPTSSNLRSVLAGRALETLSLGQSAESYLAGGDMTSALQAYQLRLAMLQALGSAGEAVSGCSPFEVADVLLAIARLQLAMGKYADVGVTALAVLGQVGGIHPSAARAIALRAQAVLLAGNGSRASGAEASGLFGSALATARAALGAGHPLVCDLAVGMAAALTAIGRHSAAGGMLEGAATLAHRALGRYHPAVLSFTVAAGHAARLASESAFQAARTKHDRPQLCHLARLHGNALCARAVALYERSLALLDGQASTGGLQLGDLLMLTTGLTRAGAAPTPEASARAHSSACASVTVAMGDSLAGSGKLPSALNAARRALDMRRALLAACQAAAADDAAAGSASSPVGRAALDEVREAWLGLVQSLQQVAALLESTGQFAEATSVLDELASAVKGVQSVVGGNAALFGLTADSVLPLVRSMARHTARLAARSIPMSSREALQRAALGFYTSRGPAPPMAVAYTVSRLMDSAAEPPGGLWARGFLASTAQRVHAGGLGLEDAPLGSYYSPTGAESVVIPEPALADILTAFVSLLADQPTPGLGGDLTQDSGVSQDSPMVPQVPRMPPASTHAADKAALTASLLDMAGVSAGMPAAGLQAAFGVPRRLGQAVSM